MSATFIRKGGTTVINIVVPGKPVPQGRPRFTRQAGYVRAYDPKGSKDYKTLIRNEIQPLFYQRPRFQPIPKGCAVSLTLFIYRPMLKGFTPRKQEQAEAGILRPTQKPDTDNYLKGVLDALNTVIFEDDSQVVDIVAKKFYSYEPRIAITIVAKEETE